MRVYISGQITGNENYKQQFKEAELWLRLKGFTPINPASAFNENLEKTLTYNELMGLDCVLLSMSDAILMLHNWQNSKGARYELNTARILGKRVFYQDKFKK